MPEEFGKSLVVNESGRGRKRVAFQLREGNITFERLAALPVRGYVQEDGIAQRGS